MTVFLFIVTSAAGHISGWLLHSIFGDGAALDNAYNEGFRQGSASSQRIADLGIQSIKDCAKNAHASAYHAAILDMRKHLDDLSKPA